MSDGTKHAILSPSSAERWMTCAGSVILEQDVVDVESEYANEGTTAHAVAADILNGGEGFVEGSTIELRQNVAGYVDKILELAEGHELLVEQRVPLTPFTLEADATGTADAVILHSDGETIGISDLKYGMGVKVYAKENPQLMLYALGAMYEYAALGNWKKAVIRIHQVRLDHFDEWEVSREELDVFAQGVKTQAHFIWDLFGSQNLAGHHLKPTDKGCRFCKVKATCPALTAHTLETVSSDFTDLTQNPVVPLSSAMDKLDRATNEQLGWYMQNLGLIEGWCKAVRARAEGELFAGREVPGFKIVQGKKGNRKWSDEAAVEKIFQDWQFKTDNIYERKILSPKKAGELLKDNPRRWKSLQEFITQSEGQPSVAPSDDPREPLQLGANADDFDVVL